jgi:hypothetical protein
MALSYVKKEPLIESIEYFRVRMIYIETVTFVF